MGSYHKRNPSDPIRLKALINIKMTLAPCYICFGFHTQHYLTPKAVVVMGHNDFTPGYEDE